MAKVIDHIENAKGKTIFSLEIIPPSKGTKIENLLEDIAPMMELQPPFIDVTFHREEYSLQQQPDGSMLEIRTRKRPGTVGICSAIMHRFKIDPVPHVLCGGINRADTEDLLIDLNYLGIENIMALRGDVAKPHKTFRAKKDGNTFASDLVEQIRQMNHGVYLHESSPYFSHSNFCIGAACYPEKHFEAVDLDVDIKHLKHKVDKGVDYLVTQMFFDNKKYFSFVERCREEGILTPIIPGLKVLSTLKQKEILPRIFFLDLPRELREELEKVSDNESAKQIGIEWCIQQCKELMDYGVPALHFYTMSKSETTMQVAKEVF